MPSMRGRGKSKFSGVGMQKFGLASSSVASHETSSQNGSPERSPRNWHRYDCKQGDAAPRLLARRQAPTDCPVSFSTLYHEETNQEKSGHTVCSRNQARDSSPNKITNSTNKEQWQEDEAVSTAVVPLTAALARC